VKLSIWEASLSQYIDSIEWVTEVSGVLSYDLVKYTHSPSIMLFTFVTKNGNPLRMEVCFCRQNHNAKNIGNFMTILKPHNIGTHLKGIETSFQMVPLFLKSFHFWASCITF
jgi:hypothetical protein